jgi:hypothetical protein
VNGAGEKEHLPATIGGLIGFALSGWAANAPLYLVLAVGVFVATALAELVIPAALETTPLGEFKLQVLQYTELFAEGFVVAAVALGVAARGLGTPLSSRSLAAGATERWLPVIAVMVLVQAIIMLTYAFSGLVEPPEPRALVYVTAPIVWILWGILGLAGPFVALAQSRAGLTVLVGFGHAFSTSLRRGNLLRLCILALITIVPTVLETLLQNELIQHHAARPIFWGNVPIDALTVGPLAAIQTAFALDFVRRMRRSEPPHPG